MLKPLSELGPLYKKCIYYEISRNQKRKEELGELGIERILEYEKDGCYTCNGYNEECSSYQTKIMRLR